MVKSNIVVFPLKYSRVSWKVHMMTSYLIWMFFTNGIQAMKHQWKKCGDRKENYVEKSTTFGDIPWEYFGQAENFSADPCIKKSSNLTTVVLISNRSSSQVFTSFVFHKSIFELIFADLCFVDFWFGTREKGIRTTSKRTESQMWTNRETGGWTTESWRKETRRRN